ncbi:MAG: polyprenyl synthetase family protein [Alphaproteobacteria bacterium]|nr:polyprenyl synthetase family protein [Alphaproteobacteria bacterium]
MINKIEMSRIALKIDKLFDSFFTQNIPSKNLQAAMRYATIGGGKKLRPYLIYTISQKLNVAEETALYVGACIEMLHAYTLIHDDLPSMDNDDTRRGKPSVHIKFNEFTAILAGDALQTEAFYLLSSDNFKIDPQIKLKIIKQTAETMGAGNLISGQMFDLEFAKNISADMATIKQIHALKTAKLISLCTAIPAILANKDNEFINKLSVYGENLGLIYQIVDDIKDSNKNEETNVVNILGREEAINKIRKLDSSCRHILKDLNLSEISSINNYILVGIL